MHKLRKLKLESSNDEKLRDVNENESKQTN